MTAIFLFLFVIVIIVYATYKAWTHTINGAVAVLNTGQDKDESFMGNLKNLIKDTGNSIANGSKKFSDKSGDILKSISKSNITISLDNEEE